MIESKVMIKSRIKKVCVMPLVSPSISFEHIDRCVWSVEKQDPVPFEFEVVIIVNSTDEVYAKSVEDRYAKDYEVIITESNGKSGRGHNERCDTYRKIYKDRGYTHLMPIDGDDYYYPMAFYSVNELEKKSKFDYLSGMAPFVDTKRVVAPPDNRPYVGLGDGRFVWSFCQNKHPLATAPVGFWDGKQCPGGEPVLCISNKAINCNLRYLDDIGLGDDYTHLCQSVLAHLAGKLTWVGTDCNEIYIYDQLLMDSSSRKDHDMDPKRGWPFDAAGVLEREIKKKKYQKLEGITRQHLPYATLPQIWSDTDKSKYIKENLLF